MGLGTWSAQMRDSEEGTEERDVVGGGEMTQAGIPEGGVSVFRLPGEA